MADAPPPTPAKGGKPSASGTPAGKPGGVQGAFTSKLGPLPVWAWGGVAIGATILYFAWARRQSAGQSSDTSPSDLGTLGQLAGGDIGIGTPTPTPTPPPGSTAPHCQWRLTPSGGKKWVCGSGYWHRANIHAAWQWVQGTLPSSAVGSALYHAVLTSASQVEHGNGPPPPHNPPGRGHHPPPKKGHSVLQGGVGSGTRPR